MIPAEPSSTWNGRPTTPEQERALGLAAVFCLLTHILKRMGYDTAPAEMSEAQVLGMMAKLGTLVNDDGRRLGLVDADA